MRNSVFVAIVVGIVTILMPDTAHANYIDPSAGAMLLQVIFGGVAGVAVLLKVFWHRLVSLPTRWSRMLHRSNRSPRDAEVVDPSSNNNDET